MNGRSDVAGHDGAWHEAPALTYGEMVKAHDIAIRDLQTWRSEIRGMVQLVKYALGASIVSGIASVIAIVSALGGGK